MSLLFVLVLLMLLFLLVVLLLLLLLFSTFPNRSLTVKLDLRAVLQSSTFFGMLWVSVILK